MQKKKTPIKGQPDFSIYTDEQVSDMCIVVQRMIGAFSYDPEIIKSLEECFNCISNEKVDRMSKFHFEDPPADNVRLLKKKSFIQRKLTSRK